MLPGPAPPRRSDRNGPFLTGLPDGRGVRSGHGVRSSVISSDTEARLIELARRALEAAVEGRPEPPVDESELSCELRAPGAAFVTLTKGGELRGCIGWLDPERELWRNVLAAAAGAAVADPRFRPVGTSELDDVRLEVSVLGPAVETRDPELLQPGRHGIIVERAVARGLLLPRVAELYGWGRSEMLEAACWKAGLQPGAWREPGTRLSVFTADVVDEPEPASAGTAKTRRHAREVVA